MSLSRFGALVLVACAVLFAANCGWYSRIMARKNLVDGSIAYKDRKFQEAEELFRLAASRDPEGETLEGRTAQLFLARTLHSRYIGDRNNKGLAEQAVTEYRKAIPQQIAEFAAARAEYDQNNGDVNAQKRYYAALNGINSTVSAIPSLLESLGNSEEAVKFQEEMAANQQLPETARTRALVSLGLKYNSCAKEITETEQTRKTVKKDGKDVYQYVKPQNPADLERLRECVAKGKHYFDQTTALETERVKSATSVDVKSLNDDQLRIFEELIAPFDSARSYRASIAYQAAYLAEMEATADAANLKTEADRKRAEADELKQVTKAIEAEKEARLAAAQEAANANANANAGK